MSQAKKSTPSKKKNASSKKTGSRSQSTQPPEQVVPIRREVGAVLSLFLALFVGISYFMNEGAFILFFSNLIKGLVGWGYWLTAPVFLLIAVILGFHRGRPVKLRVFCALMIPILFASVMSLIMYKYQLGGGDIKVISGLLFEQGQRLDSAGTLGGLLAYGLEMAFSIYGALPVLLVCLVFAVIFSMSGSFTRVASKVKLQVEAKYDPSMYEDTLRPVNSVAGRIPVSNEPKKIERINRAAYSMDIPLGEDDDVLTLLDGRGAGTKPYTAGSAESRRGKNSVKKGMLPVTPTDGVAPLSMKEAANLAGVQLNEPSLKQEPKKPESKSSTVSAEISDPPKIRKLDRAAVEAEAQAMAETISATEDKPDYRFPSPSLLRSSSGVTVDSRDEIITNRERLEGAIRSFGISASIVGVTRGPTVTRYDVELDQGVKLARVTNLAGDLALALGVVNVRIAPIPDKISTIGIEVPNRIISTVYLRDIIESPKFTNAKSKLSFALGKDISGDCVVGNIAKLPHMLIAGTTGSGKSVCMNSLILSLLYKARPDEVRLIMIDPKMVELGVYNGIPHLYVPVVTDPKKAAGALQWSVVEMLKRYRLFSEVGVRDLENYNRHCEASGEQTLPQVVIVIDELADLMLVASKEVEESICRVAQMGRAAGMHLIIATQRPSADVITGLMKANIPSRIAFAVSSAMESRIILDQGGAEKLIGMGDMLFSPVGCGKPIRIQGAFVSDEEREDVIQFIKEGSGSVQRNDEIEEFMNKAAEDKASSGDGGKASREEKGGLGGYDEMLPQAVEVVLETRSCSVSMLQRRAKLGYSRAARIVDQMEELGIVGPYEGAKPRQVIIDRDGWNQIQHRLGIISDEDLGRAAGMNADTENYDSEG